MKLESVEVWNWQGLEHVRLDDFGDGINLVVGPNGVGKSRLFRAMHALFFERYKGNAAHKQKWRTRGTSLDPKVAARFTVGDATWELEKTFLKKGGAQLKGGGETYVDGDAERKVRELLGTEKASSKGAALDQRGLWPLVWVSQHRSHLSPSDDMSDVTKGRLDDTLGAEAGIVAAGAVGEHVLRRAEEEYLEYFTGKAAKPTGDYEKAKKRVDVARERLAEVEAARETSRVQADQLARDEARLAELHEEMRVVAEALETAQQEHVEAQKLASELATLEKDVELARLADERARERREAREALAGELDAARRAAAEMAPKVEAARTVVEAEEARVQAGESALSDARTALTAARDAARRAEAQAKRARAREQLAEKRAPLDAAESVKSKLGEARDSLETFVVDEAGVEALAKADAAVSKARAALEAVAARVHIHALTDTTLEGEPLAAGESADRVVAEKWSVTIGEVAEVVVEPGGKDLTKRRDSLHDARAKLREQLDRLGVGDLAEARALLVERRRAEKDVNSLEAELRAHAPDGVEPLRDEVHALETRLKTLGEDDPGALAVDAAQDAVTDAEEAHDASQIERNAALKSLEKARKTQATREARAASQLDRVGGLEERLKTEPDAEVLTEAASTTKDALAEAERRRDLVAGKVEKLRADDIAARRDRLARSQKKKEEERKAVKEDADRLHGALGSLDADELHGAVQDAEAEVAAARAEHARLEGHALAAKRLRTVLLEARQTTQHAVWSKVTQRVKPYLWRVLPGHGLEISEGWTIAGVRDDEGETGFDDLSGGLREQVALIVRFALAEALAVNEPMPFVLDDPLVNTDPERLGRMIDILALAADKLQILVLSCNEPAYATLGEDRRFRLLPDGGVQSV